MRERLIAAFVFVVMFTLLAFGIARAYALEGLLEESEQLKVERAASLMADALEEHLEQGEQVTPDHLQDLLATDERVEYVDETGGVVAAETDDYTDEPGSLSQTEELRSGGEITLLRSRAVVDEAISDAVTPIVVLALVLIAVAALLGYAAARWLSRPFQELARVARELARGRFDVQVPRFSIPEADTVGRALETSASQMHQLVVRERDFAANASHQLRTPITALRLELEDLSLWRETPPEVAEQLNRGLRELQRLSASVDDLLALARGRQVGGVTDVDVAALAEEAVARWEAPAAKDGRRVTTAPASPLRVRLAPGPIEQILDALVGNALAHGAGEVRLAVAERDGAVRVRVSDEGSTRLSQKVLDGRAGDAGGAAPGGLALAAEIAEALGGRLTLERDPSTTFTLTLPKG